MAPTSTSETSCLASRKTATDRPASQDVSYTAGDEHSGRSPRDPQPRGDAGCRPRVVGAGGAGRGHPSTRRPAGRGRAGHRLPALAPARTVAARRDGQGGTAVLPRAGGAGASLVAPAVTPAGRRASPPGGHRRRVHPDGRRPGSADRGTSRSVPRQGHRPGARRPRAGGRRGRTGPGGGSTGRRGRLDRAVAVPNGPAGRHRLRSPDRPVHRQRRPLAPRAWLTVPHQRPQLRAFEERYGLPSDRMTEVAAFRDAEGTLVETDDIMAWSSLYVH